MMHSKTDGLIDKELLLRIPKCEAYTRERVASLIDGFPEKIDVRTALDIDLPPEAMIWCIGHLRLFDPFTQHGLACDYAEHALMNVYGDVPVDIPYTLIRETRNFIEGKISSALLEKLRSELRLLEEKEERAKNDFCVKAAWEAAWSAADIHPRNAVINAGSCALDTVSEEKRKDEMLWQVERARLYMNKI